jgi:type II secretory pathway pseudopilin PulG
MMTRLKLWAGSLGLILAALATSWLRGKKAAERAAQAKELANYVETRKRMDAVDIGDDPAVLRDWLRERGKPSGDL